MAARPKKEYRAYLKMLSRCYAKHDPRFPLYGGRGLTVSDRWRAGFENFLQDMGLAPTPGHTLERRDNNVGYAPENCVWATWKEQARNRRTSLIWTFNGESLCVAEWAERLGVDRRVLHKRNKMGWPLEQILTTPLIQKAA